MTDDVTKGSIRVYGGCCNQIQRGIKMGFKAGNLRSETVVVAAPMSFAGSAARIWKLRRAARERWGRLLLSLVAAVLTVIVWTVVLGWYLLFGVLLVPYRIVRRGQRSRRRQGLQHREVLAALQHHGDEAPRRFQ